MRATALSWLREQPSSSGTSASRVIFSFCFTRKPKNERSWPLPLLGSGIEPSSMRPISSIIEPPQSRACRLEPVESARIAAEDLLFLGLADVPAVLDLVERARVRIIPVREVRGVHDLVLADPLERLDRKSTRLNSSHSQISYAVFCLKKKNECTTDSLTHPASQS